MMGSGLGSAPNLVRELAGLQDDSADLILKALLVAQHSGIRSLGCIRLVTGVRGQEYPLSQELLSRHAKEMLKQAREIAREGPAAKGYPAAVLDRERRRTAFHAASRRVAAEEAALATPLEPVLTVPPPCPAAASPAPVEQEPGASGGSPSETGRRERRRRTKPERLAARLRRQIPLILAVVGMVCVLTGVYLAAYSRTFQPEDDSQPQIRQDAEMERHYERLGVDWSLTGLMCWFAFLSVARKR
jgi:hypothetical protein